MMMGDPSKSPIPCWKCAWLKPLINAPPLLPLPLTGDQIIKQISQVTRQVQFFPNLKHFFKVADESTMQLHANTKTNCQIKRSCDLHFGRKVCVRVL